MSENTALELLADAIRERDSARALAVQAGKALDELLDLISDIAPECEQIAVELGYAALAALKAAGLEV